MNHTNLQIIKELKRQLNLRFDKDIEKIYLFGSQITEKSNVFSDYDILILLKNDYDWLIRNEIYKVCYNVELQFDIIFDITIISENELKNSPRGKQPFILNALNKGIAA
jgi:predicted nucleotidyltransferase